MQAGDATKIIEHAPQAAFPHSSSPPPVMDGGDRVGPYQLLRVLGQGGMATVHVARHLESGVEVALKLMLPHLAAEKSFVDRFLKEGQATMGLKHPNVVEVLACGESGGRYYMALELLTGGNLEDLLLKTPRLPWPVALEFFAQLLNGLGYAHQNGVIHRDLKPANLLLSGNGVLKIADFGLAKVLGAAQVTQTGTMMGTPMYMSPEQAMGKHVDARSDLYTAGVILYELLSGTNPFKTESIAASLGLVIQGAVPTLFAQDPCVPPMAEMVVERLMQLQPEHRFSTAQDALGVLAPLVDETRARMPDLALRVTKDPTAAVRQLHTQQASTHLALAQELLKGSVSGRAQAALHLYRATLLDPDRKDITNLFEQLCRQDHFNFGAPPDARVLDSEKVSLGPAASPQALLQLAQTWRSQGNLHRAAAAYKRYLRLKPEDGFVANQLAAILGGSSWGELARLSSGKDAVPAASMQQSIMLGVAHSLEQLPNAAALGLAGAPLTQGAAQAMNQTMVERSVAAARARTAPTTASDNLPDAAENASQKQLVKYAVVAGVVVMAALGVRKVGAVFEKNAQQAMEMRRERLRANTPAQPGTPGTPVAPSNAGAAAAFEDGMASWRSNSWEDAQRKFADVQQRFPGTPEAERAEFMAAKTFLAMGDRARADAALDTFIQAHRGSADYVEAMLRRAQAKQEQMDTWGAIELLNQLLKEHPESPFAVEATLLRGEAFQRRDQKQDAAADFKTVMARVGPSHELHARARTGLEALGLPADAPAPRIPPPDAPRPDGDPQAPTP